MPRSAAILFALAAALLAAAPAARAQSEGPQRIAAVVNDDVITTQDLNARLNLALATSNVPEEEQARRRLRVQILRGYIDEKLQLQEAERLRLSVAEPEIDRALASLAQRNRLEPAAFRQALAERGIDERELRAQIRGQIAWAKVVNRELRPRVAVTQQQVELALREATSGAEDVELALSEILLPVDSADQQAAVLRQAADLVATLREGADFAALAQQVSAASSAKQGGDLGLVRPSMVLPQLRERLAKLPAGGVSDPIASPVGVHIFKVRERRGVGEQPQQQEQPQAAPTTRTVVSRVSLAQVLLPLPAEAKPEQLQAAERRAQELRPGLKACKDIEAYARKTGSDGSGALGWLAVRDLPPALQKVVSSLEPGRISEPVRGPLGVQLLMVCEREAREEAVAAAPPPPPPAPPPTPATPEQMRQRLEDEQLERLATRYMRELRKDAFIDVRVGA